MLAQFANRPNRYDTRRCIIASAIRLYSRIGHKKTNVADIAHELSMSPANIYRFFDSKRAIEAAVLEELLNERLIAIIEADRSRGSAIQRLRAVLEVIGRTYAFRSTNEQRLRALVAEATRENWSVTEVYFYRRLDIIRSLTAAGQACGEFLPGDAMTLSRCILTAMDGHLSLALISACAARPSSGEMIDFYINAVREAPGFRRATETHMQIRPPN
jgi:AcrR family transcriptional regulator